MNAPQLKTHPAAAKATEKTLSQLQSKTGQHHQSAAPRRPELGRGRLQITSVNATINTTSLQARGWHDTAPFGGEGVDL